MIIMTYQYDRVERAKTEFENMIIVGLAFLIAGLIGRLIIHAMTGK
jgi:small neutral amino acid transporter SnatA (MarC family)